MALFCTAIFAEATFSIITSLTSKCALNRMHYKKQAVFFMQKSLIDETRELAMSYIFGNLCFPMIIIILTEVILNG